MIRFLKDLFKNKEIRNKIFFTLFILIIYRLGAAIPAPRIDSVKLTASMGDENSFLMLMNMLGGGQIQQFSIFSLGVGPYITAGIIIQLLSMDVIPALTELNKQGDDGRRQIEKITRYLTVVMSMIQSILMVKMFQDNYGIVQQPGWISYIYIGVVLTAGVMFLCWLGDRISMKGIGNGISMLIFAGIVSSLPFQFRQVFDVLTKESMGKGLALFGVYILLYIVIIALVVFVTNAERKIPIQYTSSGVSRGNNDMTYIPLKINSASVTPVIFASAVMAAPLTIASLFGANKAVQTMSKFLDFQTPQGLVLYLILIVLFTFFYSHLQVNPEQMAENLKKNGSYIVGVRPGKDTENYVSTVLNRITVLGTLALVVIAAIPPLTSMFIPSLPASAALGGTGIIIVVGVALETYKDLQSQLTQRNYTGFMRGR